MEFIKQEKLKLIDWTDLTPAEQKEFDWLDEPEGEDFFRYRDWVYCTLDLTSTFGVESLRDWEGYHCDSSFSGVVVRFLQNDPDFDLEVATYIC